MRIDALPEDADDTAGQPVGTPSGQHGGGLRAIAVLEAAKSVFALLASSGLELLGPAPIRQFLGWLIEVFRVDARHSLVATFMHRVNTESVHLVALAAATYGVLHLIEAWGLWRGRIWASWLGCIGAGVYLPFEIWALVHDPGWVTLAVVIINAAIVAVLARDVIRRRHR